MPFDRQRRLVFLHIPKTAGSSVEQALNLFGPWQQENLQTGFGLIQSRDLLAQNGAGMIQPLWHGPQDNSVIPQSDDIADPDGTNGAPAGLGLAAFLSEA